jgi:hypothetical protein
VTAEIHEITDRNQTDTEWRQEISAKVDHILEDLHTALQSLDRQGILTAKHDALLEEFRPLIDQFRNPVSAYANARRARRAAGKD